MNKIFVKFCGTFAFIAAFGSTLLMVNANHRTRNSKSIGMDGKFPWHDLRLPRTLMPLNYKITLQTDLDAFHVRGSVKIRVQCLKPTKNLILHLKDMNVINAAVFKNDKDQPVPEKDIYNDEELITKLKGKEEIEEDVEKLQVIKTMQSERIEMFLIEVSEQLTPRQHYDMYITFEYPLTDGLLGFYRSYYTAKDGERR